MRRGTKRPPPHSEVREALKHARAAGADETVVFHFRKKGAAQPPTAAEAERLAKGLIDRAVKRCGCQPKRQTVFQNLGSMVVQAAPDFLLNILRQPEVYAASLNLPRGGPIDLIRPVRKAAARSKGWVTVAD